MLKKLSLTGLGIYFLLLVLLPLESFSQNEHDAYIHDGSFETTKSALPTSGYTRPRNFHEFWKDTKDNEIGPGPCLLNTNCPVQGGRHWVPINEFAGSFNSSDWWSFQWPVGYENDHMQSGYIGLRFKRFNDNGIITYEKDYIWQELKRPLKENTKYYLTFYASLGNPNFALYQSPGIQVNDWSYIDDDNTIQDMYHLKRLGAYFSISKISKFSLI